MTSRSSLSWAASASHQATCKGLTLGRGYGDAARFDQRAALNPKQREQADASIDGVVTKMESAREETCLKSLAGKIVDHKNIRCALSAKTVKSF